MLILASASPRRREILKKITKDFTVVPSDAEERTEAGLAPEETVKRLAALKAQSVFDKHPKDLVIGADTIVYFNGEVYGKPKDKEDARRMLKNLSGNIHCVYTGVALLKEGVKLNFYDKTEVEFNALSDEFIDMYVNSGIPMDKAGAYGIQSGYDIVKSFKGSYTNIVGLPLELVREVLSDLKYIGKNGV